VVSFTTIKLVLAVSFFNKGEVDFFIIRLLDNFFDLAGTVSEVKVLRKIALNARLLEVPIDTLITTIIAVNAEIYFALPL
jgi:hypothetical protein